MHQRKKYTLSQHFSSNPSPLKSPYLSTTSELCVVVGSIVLRAPTAVQSKQYSSLRCVIALAQHTASVECRTMFEVTHAIVCHAMFCRHMISSNPMCYLHVPSLAQVCNFYGTSHCCPVPPQNSFLLLVNSSPGGILSRSQGWKLFYRNTCIKPPMVMQ